jgi:hypothetical protein
MDIRCLQHILVASGFYLWAWDEVLLPMQPQAFDQPRTIPSLLC